MNKEKFSVIEVANAVDIQVIATDTTTVGEIVSVAGFESATIVVVAGTLTDGAYAVLVEEGDNSALSDASAVVDADLIGTEAGAGLALADDNKTTKLGYIGTSAYIRVSIVSTATSTGGTLGAIIIKGDPTIAPLNTQKV